MEEEEVVFELVVVEELKESVVVVGFEREEEGSVEVVEFELEEEGSLEMVGFELVLEEKPAAEKKSLAEVVMGLGIAFEVELEVMVQREKGREERKRRRVGQASLFNEVIEFRGLSALVNVMLLCFNGEFIGRNGEVQKKHKCA